MKGRKPRIDTANRSVRVDGKISLKFIWGQFEGPFQANYVIYTEPRAHPKTLRVGKTLLNPWKIRIHFEGFT